MLGCEGRTAYKQVFRAWFLMGNGLMNSHSTYHYMAAVDWCLYGVFHGSN